MGTIRFLGIFSITHLMVSIFALSVGMINVSCKWLRAKIRAKESVRNDDRQTNDR